MYLKTALTIVLLPLAAPQVLIYAVVAEPSTTPNTAHKAESRNPRSNASGPVSPTAKLLIVMLALNHSNSICSRPMAEGGCRSSSGTRARPRASKPARPSIRAFHRFRKPRELGFEAPTEEENSSGDEAADAGSAVLFSMSISWS